MDDRIPPRLVDRLDGPAVFVLLCCSGFIDAF